MKRRNWISAATMLGALLIGGASIPTSARADNPSDRGCTNASLKGTFGFYRAGVTSNGPLAALGILSFDGNGNLAGRQSVSRAGVFTYDVAVLTGASYQIEADCTGKGFMPDGTETFRIVVTGAGKGFYIFSEAPGNAVYGVGQKIEAPDNDD